MVVLLLVLVISGVDMDTVLDVIDEFQGRNQDIGAAVGDDDDNV